MSDYNKKDEKKGGILSGLSGLFKGGTTAAGGASSMGSAAGGMSGMGGLGGLFATKAGIVGMVLGGATIAAGVGVVYNFIGPSSKPVYSPDLFQDTYYQEEASLASQQRAMSRDASAAASSTLDMFREQARKDGLSLGADGGSSEAGDASAVDGEGYDDGAYSASADASADGGAVAPGAAGSGMPRLKKSSGFGGKGGGGGSGTSIPRMKSGGGLSGGIGGKFQPVYRPPAGKTSAMTASAARMKNSPKFAVPNVNKKGAFGQAKFANKMGAKAMYSADSAGSRTNASEAFSGETGGSGDVASPETGAGLGAGGAGVSDGAKLKGSDPSLNSNQSTPPAVPDPEDVDPWQEYEDMAMNSMLWALGLIIVTKILGKIAKSVPFLYYAALATGAAAIFFALKVVYAGFKMFSEFGQKMMGGIYILTGVMLAIQAWNAICGLDGGETTTTTDANGGTVSSTTYPEGQPSFLNGMSGNAIDLKL